ncbi:MAG: hypothetical protein H6852_01525 [Geminicoccaceae bacterium]|nr:hypothetical protein [Geminicoccaceae bacterium]
MNERRKSKGPEKERRAPSGSEESSTIAHSTFLAWEPSLHELFTCSPLADLELGEPGVPMPVREVVL